MEYHVTAGRKTKRFIESLLPSMLTQLKLVNSRQHLQIIVDRDNEHSGQTIPLKGVDTILVVLTPTRNLVELGVTLAHELVHVAQFAKGTLTLTPKGKRWRGRFYGSSVAYLQQPWEIDAFSKQELIFRRAIEIG
jgi:hypothetical protein